MSLYDLIVIGTGTAATTAANTVRAAGWRVAVMDYRPFGGTCAIRGCDPKKVLVGGVLAADQARRRRGRGIAGDAGVEWPELASFKRTFTDPVPEARARSYADKGIDVYRGRGRFSGPNSMEVGDEQLEARHILIAAGAEPVPLGIPGEEFLTTSDRFLELPELPRRIAIVGGGYIAAEFSNIAAVSGARVTIFQRGDRMLTGFDPDLVGWLMDSFEEQGIEVLTQTNVEGVEKMPGGFAIRTTADARGDAVEADLVMHAAGRVPALEDLDLETAGVETSKGRLCLNEYLQSTSNPAVYAAGDAAQSGPPLTPVSGHDATVVAANLLEGNHVKPDYRAVASVAFSIPPIAAVGLSEHAAKAEGKEFRMKSQKASDWFTARQAAQPVYGFKVLVENETDRILGAHLVGPHADEVINLFSLAIRHGISKEELRSTLFSYPTGASDVTNML